MHIPVLLKEVIQYLDPKPNENFIDCTFGLGGHSLAILEKNGPRGKVLGIEADQNLCGILNQQSTINNQQNRLILVNDNFTNLKEIVKQENFGPISGILLDLGISSWHLESSGRGFTFLKDEPLDMRLGNENELTAEEIINNWPEQELEKIFKEYGEERFAKAIAANICKIRIAKPIKSTFRLAEIIRKSVPGNYEKGRIHPATRIFLALRIATNQELDNLQKVLPQTIEALKRGGKIAVISFNSLEDRIIKNFLKDKADNGLVRIITKKPISAGRQEIINNPRSRSAKLRVAEKL
ncbi:MAG: 16S rRNA (cytosine(1402)-N(4))-methyltransferase RsmH [bacterium]|nr:16S rRNA (cytosine(1402)-N(4))-methyltransferase RsmH [bacterium]